MRSTERNSGSQFLRGSCSQEPGGQRALEKRMRNCKGECSDLLRDREHCPEQVPWAQKRQCPGDVGAANSKGENGKDFLKGTHSVLWGENHGLEKTVSAALRPKVHEDPLWPSPQGQHSCFFQTPQREGAAHWKTKQSSLCDYHVSGTWVTEIRKIQSLPVRSLVPLRGLQTP